MLLELIKSLPGKIFMKLTGKSSFYKKQKSLPSLSVVFIVKNSKKLLEICLSHISIIRRNITELIIIDMGSIDNTINIVNEYKKKHGNIKLFTVGISLENNTSFDILRNNLSTEEVLIVDLNKIGQTNPNVYIPDIFQPVVNSVINKSKRYDNRINGIKLLSFDLLEREKNSYILKEYIIETFNNIHMELEILTNMKDESPSNIAEKLKILNEYIDTMIEKTNRFVNLIGCPQLYENSLKDDITRLVRNYSESFGSSISCTVSGKENIVAKPLRLLLQSVMQDLLNFVLRGNNVKDMSVSLRYGKRALKLLMKYNSIGNAQEILYENSTLSHFVLQSIQNRLNLIGGSLRIRIKKSNLVELFVKMPVLSDNGEYKGDSDEII